MRDLVTALTVLGGVLPIVGAVWAWTTARGRHDALDRDLTEIARIAAANPDDVHETTRATHRVRQPTHTYAMDSYTPELIERAILRSALEDLKGPALIAGVGVVFATVGGVWSLWL